MTFAWTDYLVVAQELAKPGVAFPSEASQRAAIGRAYYAVFCHALQVFVELGEYRETGRGDDHEALARLLASSAERRRREIGVVLNRLRPARRWADYKIGTPQSGLIRAGGPACVQAQRAIDRINEVHPNPNLR